MAPELCFIPWGVPLSLQLTRHWGQLVHSTQGMFPHSFCYSGDKKVKIKTPEGPGNNFTCEPSANVVSGSWERFHVPPLKVKGQCAHLRWRKVIVGAALRASCQASIWEWNCWAEQQAESSSLRRAGRWLLFRRVEQPSTGIISRWRHGEQGGGWEGVIEEVFSSTRSPPGRFPEDGKCCLRKVHALLTSFLTCFPKVSATRHFWGCWAYLGWPLLFQWHLWATCCRRSGTSPGTLLFSRNLLTNSQCPQSSCVTWRVCGGSSLTLRQHLGFLNTEGLLFTSKWWDTPRTEMTKWSWRPSKACWGGGTGGNCGDP